MPFKQTGQGNELLEGDGFYVSFNPDPNQHPLADVLSNLAQMCSGDETFTESQAETALCIKQPNGRVKYLILNGDFRRDYEGLVEQGVEACREFFKSQDCVSVWTTKD